MRKTVLAWADTRNGVAQHESVSHALAVIERLGYESGAYDTYIRTDSHIISKTPQKTTGERFTEIVREKRHFLIYRPGRRRRFAIVPW